MKAKTHLNIFISVGVLFALTRLLAADTIVTFDAPGAGTGQFQGTLVAGITPAGVITGGYFDTNNVEHTYVRAPDGTFTTFDAPGAGTGLFQGTGPNGINPAGAITGNSSDPSSVFHGFVRAADGTITTFDAPGAGTGQFQGTVGFSINPVGVIAGEILDSNSAFHGFVRYQDGTITTFDAPGAGTGSFQGTSMVDGGCINPAGVIVGSVTDSNNVSHGFVRAADGTFTTFDVPGAAQASSRAPSH